MNKRGRPVVFATVKRIKVKQEARSVMPAVAAAYLLRELGISAQLKESDEDRLVFEITSTFNDAAPKLTKFYGPYKNESNVSFATKRLTWSFPINSKMAKITLMQSNLSRPVVILEQF